MRSSAVVSGLTAAISAGALLACLHSQFTTHDNSSCVPSVLAGLACVLRHTLGVSYPDRCLHAVPAALNFCTSRHVSRSNHACPPSTVCKGALFAKELVSVHSITLPETCDIWGKRHHSSGQPLCRTLQSRQVWKSQSKLLGQSSMSHDSQARATLTVARYLFLARS